MLVARSRLLTWLTQNVMRHMGVIAMFLVLIALIEVGARTEVFGAHVLVPSADMVRGMIDIMGAGDGWEKSILPTVSATLAASALAIPFGVMIGALLWWSSGVRKVCEPYLVVLPAIPVFALYPMFIIVFGQSNTALILTGALLGVVPMLTQTLTGLDSLPPYIERLGRVYGLTWLQRARMLFLPAISGALTTGLRVCTAYAAVGVVASEMVLSSRGLGHFIGVSYDRFDLKGMYGAILVVLLGIAIIYGVIGLIERQLEYREGVGR